MTQVVYLIKKHTHTHKKNKTQDKKVFPLCPKSLQTPTFSDFQSPAGVKIIGNQTWTYA